MTMTTMPGAIAATISPTPETANPVYVASDIKQKRIRRTKAAVAAIREAIHDLLERDHPQTVRQLFYALTVAALIHKDEIEYQRTVVRLLLEMHAASEIPFASLDDNTRSH